ncbi:MAG: hypothetical protein NC819_00865 [Candidatus Omnitrophica bacterium]|nr:hypothetical protein [Candidatus Omnitrophota bacterium]
MARAWYPHDMEPLFRTCLALYRDAPWLGLVAGVGILFIRRVRFPLITAPPGTPGRDLLKLAVEIGYYASWLLLFLLFVGFLVASGFFGVQPA